MARRLRWTARIEVLAASLALGAAVRARVVDLASTAASERERVSRRLFSSLLRSRRVYVTELITTRRQAEVIVPTRPGL